VVGWVDHLYLAVFLLCSALAWSVALVRAQWAPVAFFCAPE
jgi:hypothetical protein